MHMQLWCSDGFLSLFPFLKCSSFSKVPETYVAVLPRGIKLGALNKRMIQNTGVSEGLFN